MSGGATEVSVFPVRPPAEALTSRALSRASCGARKSRTNSAAVLPLMGCESTRVEKFINYSEEQSKKVKRGKIQIQAAESMTESCLTDTNRKERKANRGKLDWRGKSAERESNKMAFICQSFKNSTRANQALKRTHSP